MPVTVPCWLNMPGFYAPVVYSLCTHQYDLPGRKTSLMKTPSMFKSLNVVLIAFGLIGLSADARVTLVQDGSAVAAIVLPDQPTADEKIAAEDFQQHIRKMSGATLPIFAETDRPDRLCVDIGATIDGLAWRRKLQARDDLNEEAVVIHQSPERVVLVGRMPDIGTSSTTRYAVCILLEELGIRWLMPTEKGAYIPKRDTVALAEKTMIRQPGFIIRAGAPNSNVLDPKGPAEDPQRAWTLSRYAWGRRNRMGTRLSWEGGGHTYNKLVSPGAYFAEHPEYYSLRHGKRTTDQLCTTNPHVVPIAIETAKSWARIAQAKEPAAVLTISPNDGNSFCQCDHCKKLVKQSNYYGPILDFANKVARGVGEEYPDARITFHANYHAGSDPPTHIKPEPNLVFWLTKWNVDQCHPISHPNGRKWRDAIDKWVAYGKEQSNPIFLYTYYGHYATCTYFPILRVLEEELPYCYDRGIIGVYSQTDSHWGCQGLNLYVLARLLWDPKADVDAMIDEYCRLAFGPGAKAMRAYYDLLEEVTYHSPGFTGYPEQLLVIFTPEVLSKAEVLVGKAVAQVKEHLATHPDPALEWRMEFAARGERFARLYLGGYQRLGRYASLKRAGKNPSNSMLERIRKDWSEAIAIMKDPTMPGITEGDYRMGEFVGPLENMLRYVQVQGKLVFGPGPFSYADNLVNDTQVIFVSRVFKGFAPGTNMPLKPNGSGEVIWRFEAEKDCTLERAIFQTTHFSCPDRSSGGSNELAIRSPVTGGRYVVVAKNETVSFDNFYKDFTQHVRGANWFEVRFRARNGGSKTANVMDVFSVGGSVVKH